MTTPEARPDRAIKFRDDIDPENTWVVSDTHFGHENIVGYCHRPEDHEQVILAEWRAAIPADATVLHLGDLSYKSNSFFKNIIAKELTGDRKLLIAGNHDRQRYSFYRDCGFRIVKPFSIKYGSVLYDDAADRLEDEGFVAPWTISFDHYPLKRPAADPFSVHIHGHIHNNGYGGKGTPFTPFSHGQINLSCEQVHYRPVNLKRLLDGYLEGCYEPEFINPEKEAERDDR
jgi:calcineurin-like phosphoesterase family protein